MKGFLFGLGMGIGLGVLFAPMSGEETRNNLSDRANDLASSARESFEQNRDKVQRRRRSHPQHRRARHGSSSYRYRRWRFHRLKVVNK